MKNIFVATLAVLLLATTNPRANVDGALKRTMPHQGECATPLPTDFWNDSAAKPFERAEVWAWKRICLGQRADMRSAPGGSGPSEKCQPATFEENGVVSTYRMLRPEFLELILSHEPWASTPRHPRVIIRCALVRGDIYLDDLDITPNFRFHEGKIDGQVSFVGAKFKRTLSLRGSTVTGRLKAGGLEVEGGLLLRDGAFADINLTAARITGDASLSGSAVIGKLNAGGLKVGGRLLLRNGTFADIDLIDARIAQDAALDGSTITGKLNAGGLKVEDRLLLRDGRFADIDLPAARIAQDALLVGSTVAGKLNADSLEVGGRLLLRNSTFADINLTAARITEDASLAGSNVAGKLKADGVEVGGRLLLRNGTFADINLTAARITEDTSLAGSIVARNLNADSLETGGGLLLHNGTFADINLTTARITEDASLAGSTVAGKLNADSLEVGGGLLLRNGTFADINLIDAEVARNVHLAESTFGSEIDLTRAAIGGEIHLAPKWLERSPTWQRGAVLILRNVKADVLRARADSWHLSEGDGFVPTDLTGFTFNRLEGVGALGGSSMGEESAAWLISWIAAQRDFGGSYNPQPYTQLAQVLEAAGAVGKAKAIRFAGFEHKRKHDASIGVFGHILLILDRCFWGYKLYPYLVVVWFGWLVLLGWLFAQRSQQTSVRGLMGLWYSLENALPLIETNGRFKNVRHRQPWLNHFFHLQKIIGFVLATVLVALLTLVSG